MRTNSLWNRFADQNQGVAMNRKNRTRSSAFFSAALAIAAISVSMGCEPQATAKLASVGGSIATATGGAIAATGGNIATGGTTAQATTVSATGGTPPTTGGAIAATGGNTGNNTVCDAARQGQILPGTTNVVCAAIPGGYGWTLLGTGGTTGNATATGGMIASGGTSAPATTASTGGSNASGGNTSTATGICDANHVGDIFNGMVCVKNTIDIYAWVPLATATGGTVSTGGNLATGGSVSTGGSSASGGSTSTATGICDANHVGDIFNGMVCVQDTIDIYSWVPLAIGGAMATGGVASTGGATASSSSTDKYEVYSFESQHPATLVASSRWVPGQPTQADLMVWNSPQGSFIATTTISADGNYRWSLVGKLIGDYNVWYTCAGCGTNPAVGANYGANVDNLSHVSSASMAWLTCPSPGYDGRFRLNLDGTLTPAGCGSNL